MLYLFDANVLITASNMYYPLDAVPEFFSLYSPFVRYTGKCLVW